MARTQSRNTYSLALFILTAAISSAPIPALHAQAVISSVPRISGPVEADKLVTLNGNTIPIAQAKFDRGPAPAGTSGRMLLLLKRSAEQEAALQQLLNDQQLRGSSDYHKWLQPTEFGRRFGTADADIQAVTAYLASEGFQIGKTYRNKGAIEISGTAAQIHKTFHTQMHIYEVDGERFTANQSDPQIPEALAPVVAGFASLNNFRATKAMPSKQVIVDPATGTMHPLYEATPTSTAYGIAPGDLAKIYDLPANPSTANAAAIGVISDSNVNLQFISNYISLFQLSAALPTVVVDGNDPGISTDSLTTLEELELITAVDPKAGLTLYTSATSDFDTGINFAIIRAVDDDVVNVLETGASQCEASLGNDENAFLSNAWEQAAAEGISVIVAAGDAGSAGCDTPGALSGTEVSVGGLAVNGYASTVFNTAVGGTDFYYGPSGAPTTPVASYWSHGNFGTPAFTSALGYIPEQPWNDSLQTTDQVVSNPTSLEGGGGGPSTAGVAIATTSPTVLAIPYSQPSWQAGFLGVGKISTSARIVPDVSFFAGDGQNDSSYILCAQASDCSATSPTFTMTGGTAAAAAVFSGIAGLLVQQNGPQGNLNPELYALAKATASATTPTFHDVTNGSNSVACASTSTGCTKGYLSGYTASANYDAASGLGSVDAKQFLATWGTNLGALSTPTLTLSIVQGDGTAVPPIPVPAGGIPHGTQVTLTVKATGSSGVVAGDVAIVSTNAYAANKGVEALTLNSGTANDSSNGNSYLPGGTYTLQAHYPGNLKYSAANSNSLPITVTPEASQVLLISSSLPSFNAGTLTGGTLQVGTPVTITVEPFSLNGNSVGIPSGSIQVMDTYSVSGNPVTSQLTSLPINSEGAATFVLNQLPLGSHSLVFQYSGDASYLASSSITNSSGGSILAPLPTSPLQTAVSFVVGNDIAVTNLSTSTTTVSLENPTAILTAVVEGSFLPNTGHAPSGTVKFSDGNSVALVPSYDSSGNAIAVASESVMPALILGGTQTYSAQYFPDGNSVYSGGVTSNTVQISDIILGLQSTNTVTTIAASTGGKTFANTSPLVFNITVAGNLLGINFGNVTGSVTVLANGVQVGSPVTLAAGSATFTVPFQNNYLLLPNGAVTITAMYNGDGKIKGCLLCPVAAQASYGVDQISITGNSGGGGSSNPNLSGDFSIAALTTAQFVSASQTTASYGLQLTSLNNFAVNYGSKSPISLSCSAPTGVSCSFSASSSAPTTSVSLASGFSTPTLYLSAASGSQFASNPAAQERHWWPAAGGATLAFVLLGGIPSRRRKCQLFLAAFALCLLGSGLSGCGSNNLQNSAQDAGRASGFGGSGSGSQTTVSTGTYPVSVIATTTTTTNILHSVTVNLVVQ